MNHSNKYLALLVGWLETIKKNIFLLNGDEFHGRKKTHITLNKQKIMESQPNPSQRTLFNETNWYILYIQEQMTNDYIS